MGSLVHLTVLGTDAAPLVRASTIIERRRRDALAFHAVQLRVAGNLHFRLGHEQPGLRARSPASGTKEKHERQATVAYPRDLHVRLRRKASRSDEQSASSTSLA